MIITMDEMIFDISYTPMREYSFYHPNDPEELDINDIAIKTSSGELVNLPDSAVEVLIPKYLEKILDEARRLIR